MRDSVVSRHRLPQPYRTLLVCGWLALPTILLVGIMLGAGPSLSYFDPRFLLLIGLMALPAYYVWQEGVDVFEGGLLARFYVPRRYRYDRLSHWQVKFVWRVNAEILTVWDENNHIVLSRHLAHLSDVRRLIDTLSDHVTQQHAAD